MSTGQVAKEDIRFSKPTTLHEMYRKVFAISEIEQEIALKWMAGAIILGFFVTFDAWKYSQSTTLQAVENGTYICWPFFQNCKNLIWMSVLPYGYSQTIFFMVLFAIMASSVYFMYRNMWDVVHLCIAVLFAAKIYLILIDYTHKGNYDYYHNTFCLVYLLCRNKLFFLRFLFVFFYFLSTASKIYPSWMIGEYFTSLSTGLPIFPFGTEPLMTNIVIIMEMVFSWFLLSRNMVLQRAVLLFFIAFHLYSGILVGYRYPTTVLPSLIILFGPFYQPSAIPSGRTTVLGWSLMALLTVAQLMPHFISGDEKLTFEGNHYGLYMFEANHQCFGSIRRGDEVLQTIRTPSARVRCDPYNAWFVARNKFCHSDSDVIGMVLNHSVNGRPFREIVNEANICKLTYNAFGRNAWIKDEDAISTGQIPVKNMYW